MVVVVAIATEKLLLQLRSSGTFSRFAVPPMILVSYELLGLRRVDFSVIAKSIIFSTELLVASIKSLG